MAAIATWADQQRNLAESFADMAERHQQLTGQTFALLEPLLEEAEKFRDRARTFRE